MAAAFDLDLLHAVFRLDPETGTLFWRVRAPETFTRPRDAKRWNVRYAEKPAFSNGNGYMIGKLNGKAIQAHRVVWAMSSGRLPEGQIDHINGDTSDNRPANLREVSHSENQRNQKIPANNRSGQMGVCWVAGRKRWIAQIRANGKRIHLGRYVHKADAVAARQAAEQKYNYHPNHGRTATGV